MHIRQADITLQANSQQQSQQVDELQITAGYVRAGEAFNEHNLVAGVAVSLRQEQSSEQTGQVAYIDPRQALHDRHGLQDIGKLSIAQLTASATPDTPRHSSLTPQDQLKLTVIRHLYKQMTGKTLSDGDMAQLAGADMGTNRQPHRVEIALQPGGPALRFGAIVTQRHAVHTQQSLHFQAAAQIHTADGQQLAINLQFNLQREQHSSQVLQQRLGAAFKDPLVINFASNSAQLTEQTWVFDIDADGVSDTVQRLHENSGYLALDRNENSTIDDGRELFGALSGNGFADLATFDDDKNGFIDEQDAVFHQLRILVQHQDGSQRLYRLAEQGVGALYLGHTDTPWQLAAGSSQQQAGMLRSSGLFINEDGSAGTLQQIDLLV